MNRNYESFRNGIMYIMRSSGLEIGAIFYILKDVLREVEETYSNTLRQEIEAEERQRQEAEEMKKANESEDVAAETEKNDAEL